MSASTTPSPPPLSSTMVNYLLAPGVIEKPPEVDGNRVFEHVKFTFPTIFIIVVSVILFFVFMYFYLSPIIRDPSVVAPNSSQRLREKDKDWSNGLPLNDLEKAFPLTPDQHERPDGVLRWFYRWLPVNHRNQCPSKGFSLFSSPSTADKASVPTPFTLPLPSPAYFSNPSAAVDTDIDTSEYRLPSPPEVPAHRLSRLHTRPRPPPLARPVAPKHPSVYTYVRPSQSSSSPENRSPIPSPLSNILCRRDSCSTTDSLGRSAPLDQFMLVEDSIRSSPMSSGLTSPLVSLGGKSPTPSVHSMLCR